MQGFLEKQKPPFGGLGQGQRDRRAVVERGVTGGALRLTVPTRRLTK